MSSRFPPVLPVTDAMLARVAEIAKSIEASRAEHGLLPADAGVRR